MTKPLHDQSWIDGKRRARMSRVDHMAPEARELVNEYGLTVVDAFLQCGVTKPKQIRHLIATVLTELSPVVGSFAAQGVRSWRGAEGGR